MSTFFEIPDAEPVKLSPVTTTSTTVSSRLLLIVATSFFFRFLSLISLPAFVTEIVLSSESSSLIVSAFVSPKLSSSATLPTILSSVALETTIVSYESTNTTSNTSSLSLSTSLILPFSGSSKSLIDSPNSASWLFDIILPLYTIDAPAQSFFLLTPSILNLPPAVSKPSTV